MKILKKNVILTAFTLSLALVLNMPFTAIAATTPALGFSSVYGVLSSTFTDTSSATTVNGSIGFTTPPATAISGTHLNYGSVAPYTTAGVNQGTALSALNSEVCTFNFGAGPIDLSTDITHGPASVYTPGVYCSTGAMDISGPLVLSGSGTYLFRSGGALTSAAGAVVSLDSGASACDAFYTPTGAATLGANNTFVGTIIDDAGITIGANTTIIGRLLAFGGTVTTDTTTITTPSCGTASSVLNIIKNVVNTGGGTLNPSNFNISLKTGGINVSGSPAVGAASPGTSYTLTAGTYIISEDANASYNQTFGGDCDSNGNITLVSGTEKTCIVTNTYIPIPVVSTGGGVVGIQFLNPPTSNNVLVNPRIGVTKTPNPLALYSGPGLVTYDYVVWNDNGSQPLVSITVVDDKCSTVGFVSGDANADGKLNLGENWKYVCKTTLYTTTTNTVIATGFSDDPSKTRVSATAVATVPVSTPALPNTGFSESNKNIPNNIAIFSGILVLVLVSASLFLKKNNI